MAFPRVIACATVLLALAACDREPPKPKVGEGAAAAARVNGATRNAYINPQAVAGLSWPRGIFERET